LDLRERRETGKMCHNGESHNFIKSRDISVCIALGYGLDEFDSRRVLRIFLFTTASITALGPTQPPI
jgi:hypothetical protein